MCRPAICEAARAVRQLTAEHGLRVAAYGSYYRFRPDQAWEPVLQTAVELGAPLIRVWAGDCHRRGRCDTAAAGVQGRSVARSAAAHGIAVAFEFHANTLTDTLESALELLAAAEGVRTLWQPPNELQLGTWPDTAVAGKCTRVFVARRGARALAAG